MGYVMKKTKFKVIFILFLLFFLFFVISCISMPFEEVKFDSVSSSLDMFSYNENNVPDVGYVYHYKKSNQDGSEAADVWIYLESYTHTESFKIYPKTKLQGKSDLVVADYDTTGFFTKKIEGYLVSADGKRSLNASLASDDGLIFNVKLKNNIYNIRAGHTPSYNYNFDWCDLAFMYRHLINKDKDFIVGVTIPTILFPFNNKIIYAGKALFKYQGIVEYKNIKCRMYEVSGEPFKSVKGYFYTDLSNGSLVEINMPVRNNPNYNSFKFSLIEKSQFTKSEWDKFIVYQTAKALLK